jgi:hypothetical protein
MAARTPKVRKLELRTTITPVNDVIHVCGALRAALKSNLTLMTITTEHSQTSRSPRRRPVQLDSHRLKKPPV